MKISKTLFSQFLKCRLLAWKYTHPETAEFTMQEKNKSILDRGHQVGDYAVKHPAFQPIVLLDSSNRNVDLVGKTFSLLKDNVPNIAEASFVGMDNTYCQVDILHKNSEGSFDIIEVKSCSKLKEHNILDIAFQYHVVRQNLPVRRTFLMLVNPEYRMTDTLNLWEIFHLEDVTETVKDLQSRIPAQIKELMNTISEKQPPICSIGANCSDWECHYQDECLKHESSGCSSDEKRMLKGLSWRQQVQFIQKGILPSSKKDILPMKDEDVIINKAKIAEFLTNVSFPLYGLDFETIQNPVPRWSMEKPFQQIPFQYSLHVMRDWDTVEHYQFLETNDIDPRYRLAKQLKEDIPVRAKKLAYNASFEKSVIKELAVLMNDPEYLQMADNFLDLMIPFQKRWFYKGSMLGSYSIKSVLPAMFPDNDAYHQMNVQNGQMAQDAYLKAVSLPEGQKKQQIRKDMLQYCFQDTLSMIMILKKLREIAES